MEIAEFSAHKQSRHGDKVHLAKYNSPSFSKKKEEIPAKCQFDTYFQFADTFWEMANSQSRCAGVLTEQVQKLALQAVVKVKRMFLN